MKFTWKALNLLFRFDEFTGLMKDALLTLICGTHRSLTWIVKVVSQLNYLHFIIANERQSHAICYSFPTLKPVARSFAPSSGCLLLCLCLSVLTMLLQNLWMPLDITRDDVTGRSPQEQGKVRTEFVLHCGFVATRGHRSTQL